MNNKKITEKKEMDMGFKIMIFMICFCAFVMFYLGVYLTIVFELQNKEVKESCINKEVSTFLWNNGEGLRLDELTNEDKEKLNYIIDCLDGQILEEFGDKLI